MQSLTVTTEDGRTLEAIAAEGDGTPLVFHHGTPGVAIDFAPLVAAAGALGLRHVAYSRPGYAGSARHAGRSVADAAADTAALLDTLGADRAFMVGWSGGGPHALACAALIPDRVIGAALIAGVAPHDAAGLDWMDGMGEDNHVEFGAAIQGTDALTPLLEAYRGELGAVSAAQITEAFGDLLPPVDKDALTGDLADFMAGQMRASVSTGIDGWHDDDLAFVKPWGVDLAAIGVPVAVWQGSEDKMVPFAHGQWLADHVAGATVHLLPGAGHLSLIADYATTLDHLVTRGQVS